MEQISLHADVLADKVYAGWTGKNIGGTLGGPLEGIMELLDVHGYTQSFLEPVENDDLDLQLVALHCLEQNGGVMDASLLAREWVSHVHFQFDEYGHALTNMRKGLTPPLSGCYNNFFTDCMGSPIRSELWGMLCAGMPDWAAWYAYQDAIVDHAEGEGVYGEVFFAVFESLAFFSDDIPSLIQKSLAKLPAGCATRQAVELLIKCHGEGFSWKEARQKILDVFGTPNFTYAPVNIAFTLMGLLYGEGFTQRLLITTNCGYDTDCTCATIASMMGILYGSSYIDSQWTEPLGENILVSRPVQGIRAPKTIRELTERTLRARGLFLAHLEARGDLSAPVVPAETRIEYRVLPEGSVQMPDLSFTITYEDGHPAIAPNGTKRVTLTVKNELSDPYQYSLSLQAAPGFRGEPVTDALATLDPLESRSEEFLVHAPAAQKGSYPCFFVMTTWFRGLLWKVDKIPFTLVPTASWKITTGEKKEFLSLPDNRVPLPNAQEIFLLTNLFQPADCVRRIKVPVSCPVKLYIDGRLVMECNETTPVIPAYHRDSLKEWTGPLSKGPHQIQIQLTDAADAGELYFYAVAPEEAWFGADIDSYLSL